MKKNTYYESRQVLLKELFQLGKMLRGTINSVCINCGRANCVCTNKRNKKAYRLTYKDRNQKTQILYIPKKGLRKARVWISNYSKSKKILDRLVELSVKEFKMKP